MATLNKRALHYSSAVGALKVLGNIQRPNSRKHTRCTNLEESMNIMYLGIITEEDVQAGIQIFTAMNSLLDEAVKDSGASTEAVLVSLIAFHLDELNITSRIKGRMVNLLSCFPEAEEYNATRAAHRLWQRMETEIEIKEVA